MGPIPPALPSHLIGMRVGEWLGNSVLGGGRGAHKGNSFGKGFVLTFPLWVSGDVLTCIFNRHIFRIWFVGNKFVLSHSDGQRGTKTRVLASSQDPPLQGGPATPSVPRKPNDGIGSRRCGRLPIPPKNQWSGGRRQCTQEAAGLTERMRRGGGTDPKWRHDSRGAQKFLPFRRPVGGQLFGGHLPSGKYPSEGRTIKVRRKKLKLPLEESAEFKSTDTVYPGPWL